MGTERYDSGGGDEELVPIGPPFCTRRLLEWLVAVQHARAEFAEVQPDLRERQVERCRNGTGRAEFGRGWNLPVVDHKTEVWSNQACEGC